MGLPPIINSDIINKMICNHGSMKFSELNNHIKICESRLVQCKLCNVRFVNKDFDKDQNECSKIYLQCGYCKNDILRSSLSNHKTNCSKYLIECNFCKKMVERGSIQKHNSEDCQEYLVFCKFNTCGERLSRYKMSFHSLEHKYIDLLKEQNETIKEFNEKYSQLQFNYNQLKSGGNTHNFYLRLYPNGPPGRPGKFCIYLEKLNDGDGVLLNFLASISIGNVNMEQEIDFERSKNQTFAFEPQLDSKIVLNRTPIGGGMEIEVTINILQEKIPPLTQIIIDQ
ncbi:hypothetical protein ACTFIY_005143 [Dictyostelium cf. discoideum]